MQKMLKTLAHLKTSTLISYVSIFLVVSLKGSRVKVIKWWNDLKEKI